MRGMFFDPADPAWGNVRVEPCHDREWLLDLVLFGFVIQYGEFASTHSKELISRRGFRPDVLRSIVVLRGCNPVAIRECASPNQHMCAWGMCIQPGLCRSGIVHLPDVEVCFFLRGRVTARIVYWFGFKIFLQTILYVRTQVMTRNNRWGSGRAGFPRLKSVALFIFFYIRTYRYVLTRKRIRRRNSQQQAMAKQGNVEICRRRD